MILKECALTSLRERNFHALMKMPPCVFGSESKIVGIPRKNRMNKLAMIAAAAAVSSAITGCRSFEPLDMDQTARDQEVYKSDVQIPALPRTKIAVINKLSMPKDHFPAFDQYIVNQMESYVTAHFTNLGSFDTVDRKNGLTIDSEAVMSADKNGIDPSQVAGAQKILITETSVQWYAGSRMTYFPDKADSVKMITNYRMIDLQSKETVISKSIESHVEKVHGGNAAMQAIDDAAKSNAKKFAKVVSARFLPPAKVIQMRGNGLAAQVSMGKNYMAEPGEMVEFLTVETDGPIAFARGTVRIADDKRSWVEVMNHEKVGVKKGHFVKLLVAGKAGE